MAYSISPAAESLGQLVAGAAELIANVSDTPTLDAELLLAFALDSRREKVLAWPERVASEQVRERFTTLVERRLRGEPLAYLTGTKEFWSLELDVNPSVLIPRPETERLVEVVLAYAPNHRPQSVLDLGTGSGAIALALKTERPLAALTGVDVSASALQIARRNGERLGLEIQWLQSDWFSALGTDRFDIIAANPPYVSDNDAHLSRLTAEPIAALAAGADGLNAIRQIVSAAPWHLRAQGLLALEHGSRQGAAVRALLEQGSWAEIRCHQDLAGLDRVTSARVRD